MGVSVEFEDLTKARKEVINEVRKLGVIPGSEEEFCIAVATGEALTNCSSGGCKEVDITVAKNDDGIDVKIVAPCYNDMAKTRDWFDHDLDAVDLYAVHGRGCGIMRALANVRIDEGCIHMTFSPA